MHSERDAATSVRQCPLSMDRSTFAQSVPDVLFADLATGYTAADGGFEDRPFEFVGMVPTGAMSATATNMARFVRVHLHGGAVDTDRILESETVAEMHRRQFTNDKRNGRRCETRRSGLGSPQQPRERSIRYCTTRSNGRCQRRGMVHYWTRGRSVPGLLSPNDVRVGRRSATRLVRVQTGHMIL